MRGISWLAENRLASQERLCSMESVSNQWNIVVLTKTVAVICLRLINWDTLNSVMTPRLNPVTLQTSPILNPFFKPLLATHYSNVGDHGFMIPMPYILFVFCSHADDNIKQFNLQKNRGCWTWKAKPNGKRGRVRVGSPKKRRCKLTSLWWRNCRVNTLNRVKQTFKLFGVTRPRSHHYWHYVKFHTIMNYVHFKSVYFILKTYGRWTKERNIPYNRRVTL